MMGIRTLRLGALALGLAVAAACSDGSTSQFDVTMQEADGALMQTSSGLLASVSGQSAVTIDKSVVQSLDISIDRLELLPANQASEFASAGAWVNAPLSGNMSLDLMALPGQFEAALKVGQGEAPEGDYVDARLFIASATIVFSENVDLGDGFQYVAGEPGYPVEIPSGDQTGIKTDASVSISSVDGQATLELAFDPSATFLNVTGTGDGRVILSPVIRAFPEQP